MRFCKGPEVGRILRDELTRVEQRPAEVAAGAAAWGEPSRGHAPVPGVPTEGQGQGCQQTLRHVWALDQASGETRLSPGLRLYSSTLQRLYHQPEAVPNPKSKAVFQSAGEEPSWRQVTAGSLGTSGVLNSLLCFALSTGLLLQDVVRSPA